ncbi:hypothetical protein J5289_20760 [Rhizobium sp. B230/85]|uniref:hypothetical protein n=1 Tax=unclassified Rhizobium TaxID=2613769 RepID=UPI001ADC6482|nr:MULTISPECIES: hypothetical protein [unclassified Rhizobium]MBO9135238.1 hypothetical protein [Rhizobium sp. B209b/85]QXZ98951.1 hypothetical protein J5289_20760 [Rhizobium sp. B230/85]
MTLELSHQPIVVGENGHLLATDGELFWVVVVTREALEAVTHQFDATVENLTSHAGLYLAIAEQHLARKDFSHNRIWVQEEDVDLWLVSEPIRQASGRVARNLASGSRHLLPQFTANPV